MSNYGYAVFKRNVSDDALKAALLDINHEAFYDALTFEYPLDEEHCYMVSLGDHCMFQIWRENDWSKPSKRTIHTDHRHGMIAFFVEGFLFNQLTLRFGGYRWDDGIGKQEKWYPRDYPKTWLEYEMEGVMRMGKSKEDALSIFLPIINTAESYAPKELLYPKEFHAY